MRGLSLKGLLKLLAGITRLVSGRARWESSQGWPEAKGHASVSIPRAGPWDGAGKRKLCVFYSLSSNSAQMPGEIDCEPEAMDLLERCLF